MLKCPKCGGAGEIIQYEFRAWGVCPPQTLYKGQCCSCGFTAHPCSNKERAAEWFIQGMTRNPDFDHWGAEEVRARAKNIPGKGV